MLIDERIDDLSKAAAKKLLRRAVGEIAERMNCETCAMRILCGSEPSVDDCMCRVLMLLTMPTLEPDPETAGADKEEDAGTIYYDPDTMQIV